ncbi:MAG: hypothetical protein OHK0011_21070 [Turneriella sp.]
MKKAGLAKAQPRTEHVANTIAGAMFTGAATNHSLGGGLPHLDSDGDGYAEIRSVKNEQTVIFLTG